MSQDATPDLTPKVNDNMKKKGLDRLASPWLPLALTPFLSLLTILPGGAYVLPLAAPLAIYPEFVARVRRGDDRGALGLGLAWAALLSFGVILWTQLVPEYAARGIFHGEAYRQEMFAWIATGEGMENEPSRFLPQHALHLAAFLVLTLVSAGYLGLALGAALVGYMSYFVGSYAAATEHAVLGSVIAWVPWSVVRVIAFVALGVLATRPLATRFPPRVARSLWPLDRTTARWLALAGLGIALDLTIKSFVAPGYGRFLREWMR